jgi:hypothetical protein
MARVRSPGEFKQRVEKRFTRSDPDANRAELARVFFGTDQREDITPAPDVDAWEQGITNIESFLRHYARHFLDPDSYNALKHGLAVQTGEAGMQLDDGGLIKVQGTALEFLSLRRDQDGRQRWNMTTRWIDIDKTMTFVYLATALIESIWNVARARYLGESPSSINAWGKPDYREVAERFESGQESGVFVETMHVQLVYYKPRRPQ